MDGHFTTGRFGLAGEPLPNGDAQAGLDLYRNGFLGSGANQCVTCHTLPTGLGPDLMFNGLEYVPIPLGSGNEHHHSVVSDSGFNNLTMKIPQLRNLHRKVGFDRTQTTNRSGFGFLHDGSVDSLARFVSEPIFNVASDQDVADLVAFLLSFSGSDLPVGSLTDPTELLGPESNDTHAAVGVQTTLEDEAAADPDQIALIKTLIALADSGAVGLVVKGKQTGIGRGYVYIGSGEFQSDRSSEILATPALMSAAAVGSELTFTVVPSGSEFRIGVDRDSDGFFDLADSRLTALQSVHRSP